MIYYGVERILATLFLAPIYAATFQVIFSGHASEWEISNLFATEKVDAVAEFLKPGSRGQICKRGWDIITRLLSVINGPPFHGLRGNDFSFIRFTCGVLYFESLPLMSGTTVMWPISNLEAFKNSLPAPYKLARLTKLPGGIDLQKNGVKESRSQQASRRRLTKTQK